MNKPISRWWPVAALVCTGSILLFLLQRGIDHPVRQEHPGPSLPARGETASAPRPLKSPRQPASDALAAPVNEYDPADLRRNSAGQASRLEILVTDENEHRPIEGALLQLTSGPGDLQVAEGFTDFAGTAAWTLEPDEYRVQVEKAGYVPQVLDVGLVSRVSGARKEIELQKAGLVRGWVANRKGKPLDAVLITFVPIQPETVRKPGRTPARASTTSQADGSFAASVEPGVYAIQALKAPHPRAGIPRLQVVAGENPPLELQIAELADVVVISGVVEEEGGRAVPAARIRVRSVTQKGKILNQVQTDAKGEFRVELPAQKSVKVEVSAGGFQSQTRDVQIVQDTFVSFRLAGYRLFAVRVFDRKGHEIDDARVHAESLEHRRVVRRGTNGRYYSSEYPFRLYADAFHRNLGVTEVVLVERYQPEIRLSIEPGGELRGHISDASGEPVRSFFMSLRYHGETPLSRQVHSEDGSFHFEDLPPGEITLSFGAPGLKKTRRQTAIRVGELKWLEIVMDPGAQTKQPSNGSKPVDKDASVKIANAADQ